MAIAQALLPPLGSVFDVDTTNLERNYAVIERVCLCKLPEVSEMHHIEMQAEKSFFGVQVWARAFDYQHSRCRRFCEGYRKCWECVFGAMGTSDCR